MESAGPIDAGIDGESLRLTPPLRFVLRPGALRIRLPDHDRALPRGSRAARTFGAAPAVAQGGPGGSTRPLIDQLSGSPSTANATSWACGWAAVARARNSGSGPHRPPNRGVEDGFLVLRRADRPARRGDAVWPRTVVQTCVIHLMRNSFRTPQEGRADPGARPQGDLHRRHRCCRVGAAGGVRGNLGEARYPAS